MKSIRTWLIASNTLYGNLTEDDETHYGCVGKITHINWDTYVVIVDDEDQIQLEKPHRLEAWDDLFKYSIEVLQEYPCFPLYKWQFLTATEVSGNCPDHPKVSIGSESEGCINQKITSSRIISFESDIEAVGTESVVYILKGRHDLNSEVPVSIDAMDKTKNEVAPKTDAQSRCKYTDYIEKSFTYHSPKGDQPERYQQLRAKAKELAHMIDALVPESAPFNYKHDAFHNLEMAIMFANKGIACGE
jgi:hypothetical protein